MVVISAPDSGKLRPRTSPIVVKTSGVGVGRSSTGALTSPQATSRSSANSNRKRTNLPPQRNGSGSWLSGIITQILECDAVVSQLSWEEQEAACKVFVAF